MRPSTQPTPNVVTVPTSTYHCHDTAVSSLSPTRTAAADHNARGRCGRAAGGREGQQEHAQEETAGERLNPQYLVDDAAGERHRHHGDNHLDDGPDDGCPAGGREIVLVGTGLAGQRHIEVTDRRGGSRVE